MKKIPCEIIQDLLPLYLDDVCSPKSKILVEEHMQECEECRKYYASLKGEIPMMNMEMKDNNLQENEVKFFKKVKHELAIEKYLFTTLAVICTILGIGIAMFFWSGDLKTKVVVKEDYQGPNLPLSLVNETDGIVADRNVEVDYTNYDYGTIVGDNLDRVVSIQDSYVLTNTTNEDKILELAYGFVCDYGTKCTHVPLINVNGESVASEMIMGRTALRYDVELENREDYE